MKFYGLLVSSFAVLVSFSEGVTIDVIPSEIKENEVLLVNCTSETGDGSGMSFFINDQTSSIVPTFNGAVASYQVGTVTRSNNGDVFRCDDSLDPPPRFTISSSPLNVSYRGLVNDLVTPGAVEAQGMIIVTYTIDANPPVADNGVMLLKDNVEQSGIRFSVNSTAIVISPVLCGDKNATFSLQAINALGPGMATNFTVSVTSVFASLNSTDIVLDETVGLDDTDVSLQKHIVGCSDSNGADVVLTCTVPGRLSLSQTVNTDVSTPVEWKRSDFVTCGLDGGSASLTCTVSNDGGRSNTTNVGVSYSAAACHDVTCCLAPVLVVVFIAILIIAVVVIIVVVVVLKKKKK